MNNYWRKKRLELIADGLHIDRDELARFIGPTAHLVLHSTGDVTAMYPFNRAKLKGENPEQFATQAAVARAKREAMDYADARDAVAVHHVDRQVGDLAKRVNDVTNRVAGLEKREPTDRKENDDLRKRCDYLQLCKDQQAKTIGEMQVAAKNRDAFVEALEKTITNLEREREHIREGREKAVAHGLKLAKENDALRLSLTERDLRLATIRSKAAAVPEDWRISSRSVRDLLEACL